MCSSLKLIIWNGISIQFNPIFPFCIVFEAKINANTGDTYKHTHHTHTHTRKHEHFTSVNRWQYKLIRQFSTVHTMQTEWRWWECYEYDARWWRAGGGKREYWQWLLGKLNIKRGQNIHIHTYSRECKHALSPLSLIHIIHTHTHTCYEMFIYRIITWRIYTYSYYIINESMNHQQPGVYINSCSPFEPFSARPHYALYYIHCINCKYIRTYADQIFLPFVIP